MSDIPIPIGFRAEVIQQVVQLVRAGESCALVGVGSSGKSNIARHLARADVRREYFGAEAGRTLVVYLNCKPFARRAAHELYLHALDQVTRAVETHEGPLASQFASLETLWQAAQAEPAVLALRNLERAVALLVHSSAEHIVIALDDCDDLFAHCPPELFSDLRALRDNHKVRLAYMTLSRREPAFLRENTPEYEELFELVSAPGHTLPVSPYVQSDGMLMLRRLAARQTPPRHMAEPEAGRLYELAGGHAGLLRSLFFATQFSADLAAASMSASAWQRLGAHADVEGECRKIWDSLEPEEQADLERLIRRKPPTSDGLRRLEKRGLVRVHLNRPVEIFSPIFEECLAAMLGLMPGERAADSAPANIEVEFIEVGRQARVNGQLITSLLAPEYEILRCLAATSPEPCSLVQLIDAMRLAEQAERSERAIGNPRRRLDEYIRQLKAKIGPAGYHIQPAGDGYRLGE
jgi:hypothetical protein